MKIAVTSTGPSLDDSVETRFGRCAYFLIINPDDMEFEVIENPNIALGGGAGIQSAQLMADKNVTAVLTGNCGPNAFQTFGAAGIKVITGVSGNIRQAVQKFKEGSLDYSGGPNVQSHYGMGKGGGMGPGRGMGRGGGMGRSMGGGRGMAQSGMSLNRQESQSGQPPFQSPSTQKKSGSESEKKNELAELRKQAEKLREQMEQTLSRIKELTDKNE